MAAWLKKATEAAQAQGAKIAASDTYKNAKQTVQLNANKAGILAGTKYGHASFKGAFPQINEPMLAGFSAKVINGEALTPAQLYFTPSYVCLYMVLQKEVKVTLPFSTVARVEEGYLNPTRDAATGQVLPGTVAHPPVIVPAAEGPPTSLKLFCHDNVVHSFANVEAFQTFANLFHFLWSRFNPSAPPMSVPAAPSAFHTQFALDVGERLLASFTARTNDAKAVTLYITESMLVFKRDLDPVYLPLDTIAAITRCSTSGPADKSKKHPDLTPMSAAALAAPTPAAPPAYDAPPSTGPPPAAGAPPPAAAGGAATENAFQVTLQDGQVLDFYYCSAYFECHNMLQMAWAKRTGRQPALAY